MTVFDALAHGKTFLKKAATADAESSAVFLLSAIHNSPPGQLLQYGNQPLSDMQIKKYLSFLDRRAKGEPASQIVGTIQLHNLTIKVTKDVLTPRPETEELIEIIIDYLKTHPEIENFLDIGSGSGVIALTVANYAQNERRDLSIKATDISAPALKIAAANARLNGLAKRIVFENIDIGATVIPVNCLIGANLPYVPSDRIKLLTKEVQEYEPRIALDGGPDGLDCYRALFANIALSRYKPLAIIGEIDESHNKTPIKKMLAEHNLAYTVNVRPDLAGQNRFFMASPLIASSLPVLP